MLVVMKFNQRINLNSQSLAKNDLLIIDFAKMLFGPFSEGYVVAGYGMHTHMKFLMMSGRGSLYEDAFEPCRETFCQWLGSEKELFPDKEFGQAEIPVQSGMETEGVTDLDKAVERFSLASDAFLMFGYCGNHKVFKSYASDPLKADAVTYLQAVAMDLWNGRRAEQK